MASNFDSEQYRREGWKIAKEAECTHYARLGLEDGHPYTPAQVDEAYQDRYRWWRARERQRDSGALNNPLIRLVGEHIGTALENLKAAADCLKDADKKSAYDHELLAKQAQQREEKFIEFVRFTLIDKKLTQAERKDLLKQGQELEIPQERAETLIQEELERVGAQEVFEAPSVGQRGQQGAGPSQDPPELEVSDSHFQLGVLRKGERHRRLITIENKGGSILQGYLSSSRPEWLQVSPSAIDQGRHHQQAEIVVDTNGLEPGSHYKGVVKIRSNGGARSVTVECSVEIPEVAMARFKKGLVWLGLLGGGLFGYAFYQFLPLGPERQAITLIAAFLGVVGVTVVGARLGSWAGGCGALIGLWIILAILQAYWLEGFSILSWAVIYAALVHTTARGLFVSTQTKNRKPIIPVVVAALSLPILAVLVGVYAGKHVPSGLAQRSAPQHQAGRQAATMRVPHSLFGRWRGRVRNEPAEIDINRLTRGNVVLGRINYSHVIEKIDVEPQRDGRIVLKGRSFQRQPGFHASFWLDTFYGKLSPDGRSMSGSFRDQAGNRGNWFVSKVSAPAANTRRVSEPPPPATHYSRPTIVSATAVTPGAAQNLVITGRGFGHQNPYNGNSRYIMVSDLTRYWNAGSTRGSDLVTLNVRQWTDSRITIAGFTGAYGQWRLNVGDRVQIQVWNAQTGLGPASSIVSVQAQSSSRRSLSSPVPGRQVRTFVPAQGTFLQRQLANSSPQVVQNATLYLDVVPDDATILVDRSKRFSGSPVRVELTAGSHQLQIWKEGYQTVRQQVDLTAGHYKRISVVLAPQLPGPRSAIVNRPGQQQRTIQPRQNLRLPGRSQGVLTWEGQVHGTSLVSIEGNHASIGRIVNGALPGGPCAVRLLDSNQAMLQTSPAQWNSWNLIVLKVHGNGSVTVRLTWSRLR